MKMLQSPNPGIVLRDFLKEKSIDSKDFPISLGVDEAFLSKLLEGNRTLFLLSVQPILGNEDTIQSCYAPATPII